LLDYEYVCDRERRGQWDLREVKEELDRGDCQERK
jgi:hypothetical protein